MFFPKEHRKRCEKTLFTRFYTVFAFSTCQLCKKKEHIGPKGTNYRSKPHTLLTRQTKKAKKRSRHSFCLGGYSYHPGS